MLEYIYSAELKRRDMVNTSILTLCFRLLYKDYTCSYMPGMMQYATTPFQSGIGLPDSNSLPLALLGCLLGRFLADRLGHLDLAAAAALRPLRVCLALTLELTLPSPPPVSEPLLARPEALSLETRRLHQSANSPVVLAVTVILAQLQDAVRLAGLHSSDLEGDA